MIPKPVFFSFFHKIYGLGSWGGGWGGEGDRGQMPGERRTGPGRSLREGCLGVGGPGWRVWKGEVVRKINQSRRKGKTSWGITWKGVYHWYNGSSSLKEAVWGLFLGLEDQIAAVFRQVAVGPCRKPFNPWYL